MDLPPRLGLALLMKARVGVLDEPGDGRALLAEAGETRERGAGGTAKPGNCSAG